MPIQPMNFAGIAPQGNPTAKQFMPAIEAGMKMRYLPETMRINNLYKEALANYYKSPALQMRGFTPLGKTFLEPALIKAVLNQYGAKTNQDIKGFEYNPDNNANPDSGYSGQAASTQDIHDIAQNGNGAYQDGNDEVQNSEELSRQKMTSDTDTRKRNLFASNIEKTLNMINPKSLTVFNGLGGQIKLAMENAKALAGEPTSKEYTEYKKNMDRIHYLSDQVTQFYGSSVQPSAVQEKLSRFDISGLFSDPETGLQRFQSGKDLLAAELKTYRDALKSKSVYRGNEEKGLSSGSQSDGNKIYKWNHQSRSIELDE